MIINKSLALTGKIELNGVACHLHSTPISRQVYDEYFEPMDMAFSRIHKNGLSGLGPKSAYNMLKKVSNNLGEWDLVNNGLMAEIRRLTNILLPSPAGWETTPYQSLINQGKISAEDQAEIDGVLVFFTLSFAVMGRKQVMAIFPALEGWGFRLESLNFTEYADSLLMLTEDGNSTGQANT